MTGALAPLPAFAQTAAQDPLQPPPTTPAEDSARGRLQASLEVAAGYIDNLFATRRDEVDDMVVVVKPRLSYVIGEGDRRFSAHIDGEFGRYDENDGEDYDDWSVGVDGRYALSRRATLIGGADYEGRHESRTSPEDVRGTEPTEYERSYLFGGLLQQSDGTWVPTTVNVYDVVFGGADYTGSGTFSAFTQAAEDARAIINYIHEYAIPADEVE